MKFKASLDLAAWIITASILLLFLAVSGFGLITIPHTFIPGLIPIVLPWVIILVCFVLSPRYYIVHADRIIIKRLWRSVIISRRDIQLCRTVTSIEIGGLTRYGGVGGLFGYFGVFLSSQLGLLKLYATRQKNFVMLHTNSNKRIMLSPDEPLAFTRLVCD